MNNVSLSLRGLKKRSDLHLARKAWHIATVFLMFLIWVLAPAWVSYWILAIALILFIPIDIARQFYPALNDWAIHAFRAIIRENEVHRLAGTTYLLLGVGVVACFFPRPITSVTLLFLAFADPIASYVGIRYGTDKILGNKSFQGTLAAYVVCAVLSFTYVFSAGHSFGRSVVFCFLAAAIGALAELVPIARIDDNFTLPVVSAIGLQGLFHFFGFMTGMG